MSYTKTTPQPSGLQPNETAVTLDTGDMVAAHGVTGVEPNTGNPAITSSARVINSDGTDRLDATGQPITSAFAHTSTQAEIAAAGGISAVQKCCLMAVLGEPTSPLWTDPIHAQMLANVSIRTAIASAAHAGPVNAGALL